MEPENTNRLQLLPCENNEPLKAVTATTETEESVVEEPITPFELPLQRQLHLRKSPAVAISSVWHRFVRMLLGDPVELQQGGNTEQSPESLAVAQDEEHIQALFAVMRREQRRERAYRRYMLVSSILVILSAVLWFTLKHDHKSPVFMPVQLINISNLIIGKLLDSQARQRTIKELTKLEDVRAVGPLIDTLSFRAEELKPQVKWTLTMLLPRLQATDASMLNTQRRNTLHKVLMSDNINLIIAILKAYEQIGDSRDLAAVERLVNIKRNVGDNGRVYTAALECLPYLQANVERGRAATTLLRASDVVSGTPDTLLRAAQGGPAPATEQLLRIPYNGNDRIH